MLELLWPPGSFVLFNHFRLVLLSSSSILFCISVMRVCVKPYVFDFYVEGTVVTECCMCLCSTDELYFVIIFSNLSYLLLYNKCCYVLFNSKLSTDVTFSVFCTSYHCHCFEGCIL